MTGYFPKQITGEMNQNLIVYWSIWWLMHIRVDVLTSSSKEKKLFEVCKYAICRQIDLYHLESRKIRNEFWIMAMCQLINSLIFSTKQQKFRPHEIFTSSRLESLETGHMRNWKIFIFTYFLSFSLFLNSKTFVVFCFVGRLWTGSHWRLLYSLNGSVAWIPTDSISFEFPDTGSKFDNSPFYFDTSCNKILCFSCCKSTLNEWINFDFINFS